MPPYDGSVSANPIAEPFRTGGAGRPSGEFEPAAFRRLARLHEEIADAARLAKLAGRMPVAAAALIAGCALIITLSAQTVPVASLALWTLFVAAAAIALLRLPRGMPPWCFDLSVLRAFALDLNAVMLYGGFAWGAGAFLALPADAGPAGLAGYAAASGAVAAAVVKARTATLYFFAPNFALAAAAAYFGAAGAGAAAIIVLLGMVIFAAAAEFERMAARRTAAPARPALTIS